MNSVLPHLLLVNDNSDAVKQLLLLLEPLPVRLSVVPGGVEAIEVLRSTRVDLLLTEIAIGEFDCWRLTRLVRSGIYQSSSDIPIIIITQLWCERITEVTAREFGINHLMTFADAEHLPELVMHCMQGHCSSVRRARILVVEDNPDNARLVSKILRERFDVDLAADGQQGLAVWKQNVYDLVLLDVMLPKMSGEDVLHEILSLSPQQPVVVMTAHGSIDLAEKLMRRGAVDFITKPFRPAQLRQVCELAARRDDYLISHAQFAQRLESVQQLQNLLGNIIDSMPSIMIAVDCDCRVTQWNQQAELKLGIAAVDALGQPLEDLSIAQVGMLEVRQAIKEQQVKIKTKVPNNTGGPLCFFDKTIYPLSEAGCGGAVIRIDDVTDRVLLEERVIQTKKMASLGELIAGIAHEINNPLAGVLQNAQVIRNRLDTSVNKNRLAAEALGTTMETVAQYHQERGVASRLDAIMESGVRAAKIIETMLAFSYQGGTKVKPENLAELLDKSLELASSHYSLKNKVDFKSLEIVRVYDPQLPLVNCDAGQIQQVLLNLLMNGAHAMGEKQRRLPTEQQGLYRGRFEMRLSLREGNVQIEIEDSGPGIDEASLPRVFDPFFTTKEVGEGTGLGLFISYLIVTENHHGTMTVSSSAGRGATFTISLPLNQS
ncbi:MAG TPA: response regulator [Malonomonas sp.]